MCKIKKFVHISEFVIYLFIDKNQTYNVTLLNFPTVILVFLLQFSSITLSQVHQYHVKIII